ncbi:hypothetical protein [Bryobacter aggregatus]|uniref:hypothetical protein n=1 Tax=Bryobacter aggregatus TaxID=360054 RepID=UPI0004E0C035|nr:hypothetical protein [Bryobacter aggregatus]
MILTLAVCLGSLPALGSLIVVNSAQKLTEAADLVVVGTLTGSYQRGDFAAVTIAVSRTLKGVSPSQTVDAETSFSQRATGPIPSKYSLSGIWFLQKDDAGVLKVLPAQEGDVDLQFRALPVRADVPAPPYNYQPSQPAIEKVAFEVLALAEERRGLGFVDTLVRSLQGINSLAVQSAFEALASSKEPALRAAGLAVLIQNQNPQALIQLEKDLPGILAPVSGPTNEELWGIAAAIELMYRNPDPAGLAALGRIGSSRNLPYMLQRAIAYAHRCIHTKETLPYLGQLLENSNSSLRYEGVFGLASFANGLPTITRENVVTMSYLNGTPKPGISTRETWDQMPTVEPFQKNEAKYLNFWRDWLRDWLRNNPI